MGEVAAPNSPSACISVSLCFSAESGHSLFDALVSGGPGLPRRRYPSACCQLSLGTYPSSACQAVSAEPGHTLYVFHEPLGHKRPSLMG